MHAFKLCAVFSMMAATAFAHKCKPNPPASGYCYYSPTDMRACHHYHECKTPNGACGYNNKGEMVCS
ncbi:unnamed protein product [Zymoseptoria tritici ST99CH_1A5]|uniref:AvrStb6 n=3 Tax=Zymoseptoria tritici TaxID=1047171 RepID=F9X6N4_ZYMTI|nr:uncharacterized protein MYCGRDRAFT_103572 [Zymoseptoria tritici IPO323]EGP88652.1 hypothetical protein MYCGRDRAFT_103572 [Zymoseptoria tritici IPO323]SMR48293.1 unnamed protein product [Zymoseptoria tritici ST99CH_1E4]SMR49465.1 unnamed protein product [Zymoseptoria tritici ST99CH_3D1]SMY22163.1 unnamed protein product [Zymoseptoria tritici ST99CH_1A5]